MDVKIRPMRREDIPQIAGISCESLQESWNESALMGEYGSPSSLWLAAAEGQSVCGYIGFRTVLDEGELVSIAVLREYRGLGVGSMLLREALRQCDINKIGQLSLEVRESNQAAVRLYRKFGFIESGRRIGFYQNPREDALIFCRFRVYT